MKYMLLIHHVDESEFPEGLGPQLLAESVEYCHELNRNGQYIDAAPLHPSAETISVTVRDGKRLVTDGPLAETSEQIGGFFMVDARIIEDTVILVAEISRHDLRDQRLDLADDNSFNARIQRE